MTVTKSRYIPTKNYFIAAAVLIGVILLFIYIFEWYNVKNKEELLNSYLLETNTLSLEINTIEELEGILLEQPENYFIFTGYTGDEIEKELEKDLKNVIDDYHLHSNFYYFNVTELKDDENFIKELSDTLNYDINTLPSIIYILEGNVESVVDKDNNEYLEVEDFKNLLQEENFEKGL